MKTVEPEHWRRYTPPRRRGSLKDAFLEIEQDKDTKVSSPSEFQLFMVSVKLFFGISYLSLPNTFAQVGLLGGVVLFTTVIIINAVTMMQILRVAEYYGDVKSYSDLGERVFGRRGKQVVDVCILVKQIGTCVTYLYFVSTQLDFIICQYSEKCLGNRIYMLLLIVPVIIMSSIGSYKFLSYLSIPSVLIAITGMLCIFYYSFLQMAESTTSQEPLKIFDFWKMMGRIGLAMYLFDGTAIVINVMAEAGNKKFEAKYPSILMRAITFDLTLFVCFAVICYSVYREETQPIFTMSLVPINSMVIFIFVCVCINALTSYPVQILAAFAIIEKFTLSPTDTMGVGVVKRVTLRALIIIMTTLLCMVVKTFTDFINIAGALGSVTVAFVLPQMFYFKAFGDTMNLRQKAGCIFIAVFGLCGGSYSIYFSIHKLASGDFS